MGRHFRHQTIRDLAGHHVPNPLVEPATEEGRLAAEEGAQAARGAIALVDGTLWACPTPWAFGIWPIAAVPVPGYRG